jgi:hypothetical protein
MQTIQGGQKEPWMLNSGSQAASGKARKIVMPMNKDRDIIGLTESGEGWGRFFCLMTSRIIVLVMGWYCKLTYQVE